KSSLRLKNVLASCNNSFDFSSPVPPVSSVLNGLFQIPPKTDPPISPPAASPVFLINRRRDGSDTLSFPVFFLPSLSAIVFITLFCFCILDKQGSLFLNSFMISSIILVLIICNSIHSFFVEYCLILKPLKNIPSINQIKITLLIVLFFQSNYHKKMDRPFSLI